jgi:hypothetical protein
MPATIPSIMPPLQCSPAVVFRWLPNHTQRCIAVTSNVGFVPIAVRWISRYRFTQRPQSGRSNSELFNLWAFAPRHRCPLLRGNGSEQICNAPVSGQKTGNQFPTKAGLSARSSEAESTGWRAMCCGPPRRNAPRPRPLASWSWFCTNPSESVAPPRACSRHGVNALYSQKSQFVILPTQ